MSSFGWLDASEDERRKMMNAVRLFNEKETRDELGIGTVRDALSDVLFPGTSTIQTRARYFFFIPWTYLQAEKRIRNHRESADKIARWSRDDEIRLIDRLIESGESKGVIGIDARKALKRLPSNIYWQGLGSLGIRFYPDSQSQYHRHLSAAGAPQKKTSIAGELEGQAIHAGPNWHPGLPTAPKDFPSKANLRLRPNESAYLTERIMNFAPSSLFAFLVDQGKGSQRVEFPWQHHQFGEFTTTIKDNLWHARNFSEAIHGAALLYNRMLAEECKNEDLIERYGNLFTEWSEEMIERQEAHSSWSRDQFWVTVDGAGNNIPPRTKEFVDDWLDMAVSGGNPEKLLNNNNARVLISDRERSLKKSQARMGNINALKLWSGASGIGRLDYRWRIARQIVEDVLEGRVEVGDDA